jgi:hypothetical protein
MKPASQLFTATMAKLYADQGYLRKAAEIYRHLLDGQPDRRDLNEKLAAVEAQIARQIRPDWKELVLLLNEWVALQKAYMLHRQGNGKEASDE